MPVVSRIEEVRTHIRTMRAEGRSIEFVPTMGALHEGHLSLVKLASRPGGCVVVSIFVNPTQFGPGEDFEAYPRDLEGDLKLLEREGVDLVFAPPVDEMYPVGVADTKVDPGEIGRVAEGHYRPGHFVGVATVCAKLFSIVEPTRVYLGRKDAQQVAVLSRMIRDLHLPIEVVAAPTIREPDGLAMSSRNVRLSPSERTAAPVLFRGLQEAKRRFEEGEVSADRLATAAREVISGHSVVRLQYLDVVDPRTFRPVERATPESLVVLAAFVGSVRLIDNVTLGDRSVAGPSEEENP